MQIRYIETSALLAALLEKDTEALAGLRAAGRYITSALTVAEAARALVRARVAGHLDPADEGRAFRDLSRFERRCAIFAITPEVLARTGRPFPVEPIRTLDAIHLATVELLGEPPALVVVVSRDARIRANARALGFVVS